MTEKLTRFYNVAYSFSELQRWYGRRKTDISRRVDSVLKGRGGKNVLKHGWQEKAIEFIKYAVPQIGAVTVRQVHYYLVGLSLPDYANDLRHYQRLVEFLLKARLLGVISWHDIIEEESRYYEPYVSGVTSVEEAIKMAHIPPLGRNPWDEIGKRVFVFTEKRELFNQIDVVAMKYYVYLVSFKGYGAVWARMSMLKHKFDEAVNSGYKTYVLVISDHDPSGLDINRFYMSIIKNYWRYDVEEVRVALKAKQIIDYDLPPNPAKEKDPRYKWYRRLFGDESWEVDALVKVDVRHLQNLLEEAIHNILGNDKPRFSKVLEENAKLEEEARKELTKRLQKSVT